MTATTPCYRHPRGVWMLACPECTAWHLPIAIAHRDEVAAVSATPRTPEARDVPRAALRLVA
jgi:hypothetical protein